MPTGADLFASSLCQLGIDRVFTLVGDHLNEVLLSIAQAGITVVDFRHESGVTHAADSWARIQRKPALTLVTGGPGHTNSLTGIATAHLCCSPLIAVSGAPSNAIAGRQVFQVIDQAAMALPATKWSANATSPSQVPYLLGRAYNEANSGRKGAVHLTIPVDVFAGSTEKSLPMPPAAPQSFGAPGREEVEQALALLREAKQPVVIAGSGCWWGHAENELEQFLRVTQLPMYTVTLGRAMVPDTAPNVWGHADPAINRAALTAFKEADVVLILGKRIDYRLALGGPRLFDPKAKIIQVDIHGPELGAARPITQAICADARATLQSMLEVAGPKQWPVLGGWSAKLREYTDTYQQKLNATAQDQSTPMHPAALFARLRDSLPADTYYAWDGGDFVHWGRAMIPATIRGGWSRLGPMGTIGSALPMCITMQMAYPGKPVVMITGDGSLGFYLAELETLVRYKLPVVIIVGNDGGWGLERELQRELTGDQTVACELQHTRYDIIMKGFGGDGETVERPDEVAPAVQRAFASGKPYLINAIVRGSRSPFTEWQIMGKK
jgi:acetolactate synthase-1/2/3 large subunit